MIHIIYFGTTHLNSGTRIGKECFISDQILQQCLFHCRKSRKGIYKVNPVGQSVSACGGVVHAMTSLPIVPQILM